MIDFLKNKIQNYYKDDLNIQFPDTMTYERSNGLLIFKRNNQIYDNLTEMQP